jgi:hypothetical protein
MVNRNERRVMRLALVLCAMGTMNACAPASRTSDDLRVTYPLQVDNRTDFEVVVYAMISATGRGPRLGSARPLAKTVLNIPGDLVETHNMFAVQLHAIGAPPTVPNWVSYGTVLGENMVAQLDIYGDGAGNLRMSSLTTRLARTYK